MDMGIWVGLLRSPCGFGIFFFDSLDFQHWVFSFLILCFELVGTGVVTVRLVNK
jgi:hypothetical protein